MVARIFKRDGGLQRQAFKKVGFVKREFAAVGRGDDQLGHLAAVAIGERINEQLIGSSRRRLRPSARCRVVAPSVSRTSTGAGKGRAGHLQLAHHDAQHGLQHFLFADGGVHLARSLKQRLQPRHLLLQFDRFAAGGKLSVQLPSMTPVESKCSTERQGAREQGNEGTR